jgi:predicted transcriptional regulator
MDSATTMDTKKLRQVRADSHRGRVAQALSGNDWMDCYNVAEETVYGTDGASKVLSDLHRVKCTKRQTVKEKDGPQYEYKLKDSTEIVE